jgi:Ca2+-binding EF-hand superfamily protein
MTMSGAVAALPLCPLTVSAAEPAKQDQHTYKMPSSMGQLMKMDPVQCFKMMDRDQKGYVTKEDFMKFQEELWKRMDKQQAGKVTVPEFTDMG